VAELLHPAEPVLLDLGGLDGVDPGPWSDRVRLVRASTGSAWDLPVVGPVPAVSAVLIRPDGHVAWTSAEGSERLPAALTTWFGPPTSTGTSTGTRTGT
jgi:hypothetical protein